MISVFKAYVVGLEKVWDNRKMLWLIYLLNLFFAYLITIPVSMMLGKGLDGNLAADEMLTKFDLTYLITIIRDFGSGLDLRRLLLTFGVVFIFLNTFVAGGILQVFYRSEKFTLPEFITGATQYFSRFLRLFLFSLLFFLSAMLVVSLLGQISNAITKGVQTELWPFILFSLRISILIILLAVINMLFDYAKIITVVNDFHGMYQTVIRAITFVKTHLSQTVGLYFLYFVTIGFVTALYLLVEQFITVSSGLAVLIFFLWSQVFMVTRLALRLAFFSGQLTFYQHSNTAVPGLSKEMLDNALTA